MGKLINVVPQDVQQQMDNELAARFILPNLDATENSFNEQNEDSDQYEIQDHKVFKLNDQQLDAIVDKMMQI